MIELWIELRKETSEQLIVIASTLEKVRRDVSIARVTGSSFAVAGGVTAIVGTVLSVVTAGIAAPAVVAVCGGMASIAGAATSGISQIVEAVMSGNDMTTAKNALESDRKASEEIQKFTEKLENTAKCLDMEGLSREEIVTYFIFHREFYASGLRSPAFDLYYMRVPEAVFRVASAVLSVSGKAANAICTGVRIANAIRVAADVAESAAAGARTAGTAAVETAGMAAEVVSGAGTVVRTGLTTGAKVIAGVGIAVSTAVHIYIYVYLLFYICCAVECSTMVTAYVHLSRKVVDMKTNDNLKHEMSQTVSSFG